MRRMRENQVDVELDTTEGNLGYQWEKKSVLIFTYSNN